MRDKKILLIVVVVLLFVSLACSCVPSVRESDNVNVVVVADASPAVDSVVRALEEQGYNVRTEHYPTVLVQQAAEAALTQYPEQFIVLVTDAYHLRVAEPAYSIYTKMGNAFDPTVFVCAHGTPSTRWEDYERLGVMSPAFGISGAGAMGSWVMQEQSAPQYVTSEMIQAAEFPFVYMGTQDALFDNLGEDYECAITTQSAARQRVTTPTPTSLAINYGAMLVGGEPWRVGTLDNLDKLQEAIDKGVAQADSQLADAHSSLFFLPGNTLETIERYWRSERGETTFVAVADVSGSMEDWTAGIGGLRKIEALRNDLRQILDYYPFDFDYEEMVLVFFSNRVTQIVVRDSGSLNQARQHTDDIMADGYTAFYDAVYDALQRKPDYLLVMSDGQDTSSVKSRADVCDLAASLSEEGHETQLLGVAYGRGRDELEKLQSCIGGRVVDGGEGAILEGMLQLFGSWD
ncbi:MAG: vWA domain-containing protein [Anaerolineae bacterium]